MTGANNDILPIPGWAAFHSLLSEPLPKTNTGILPLIDRPATEYSTLTTGILQMMKLNNLIVGNNHPIVLSADLAIYISRRLLKY